VPERIGRDCFASASANTLPCRELDGCAALSKFCKVVESFQARFESHRMRELLEVSRGARPHAGFRAVEMAIS